MPQPLQSMFATAAQGLEPLLADELKALGAAEVRERRGGVAFRGEPETAYRVCLWSRLASRVLLHLAEFPAASPEALYAGVRAIEWEDHLAPEATLAVDFTSVRSAITHTRFGALKTKDAIVDRFRDRLGVRPSVRLERPELRINVHVLKDNATVSVDLAGEGLHRRGYRPLGAPAALKENLAAAILIRAGWPALAAEGRPLLDPFCGSGTFCVEAAMMASDTAPGLQRDYFGFQGWLGHRPKLWARLIDEARARRDAGWSALPVIIGGDRDPKAVALTEAASRSAGFTDVIRVVCRDALRTRPPAGQSPGLLVANPPYGERLERHGDLVRLYGELGGLFKREFPGWRAAVFSGSGIPVGLKPSRTYRLHNGPLECELALFDLANVPAAPSAADESTAMFANRLRKNLRTVGRWARREGIDCYRLYDADMPEFNVAVDIYRGERLWVHVQEYQAPANIPEDRALRRLQGVLAAVEQVLEVPADQVFLKRRKRQKGGGQYEKMDSSRRFHEVREHGCRLWVNFSDYLDTGLFLDHRPVRRMIQAMASGKRFLNLFGYTGAATVHAAVGGARETLTVDLSRTYLDWARRNLDLNGCPADAHRMVRADCLVWLDEPARGREEPFDLIFLDPPTFSRSKRMEDTLDVQRDHIRLIQGAVRLLADGGTLLFSTNLRRFSLDLDALPGLTVTDISRESLPKDFQRNPRIHRCWRIERSAG